MINLKVLSKKKSTAKNELKMGTKFVYKPDLAGPIFSTPFIKKICARKDGNNTITPKIIIPLIPGKIKLSVYVS